MNLEFHYYVIHYLALRAGLPDAEAQLVAYSSQFVDDNIVSYEVLTDRGVYPTLATQSYGWWDDSFSRQVYLPFHFFPGGDRGGSALVRRDGTGNPQSCMANSAGVKELLIRALRSRDLYRVGIGLHTYADSWAHQNFSGLLEAWNALSADSPLPGIGHAQALVTPDELDADWTDGRLTPARSHIRNRERFAEAAGKIYRYLCAYNRRPFADADDVVGDLFTRLLSADVNRRSEERILDLTIDSGIQPYDRKDWLRQAVHMEEDPLVEELLAGNSKLRWLKDTVLDRSKVLRGNRLEARAGFYHSHLYRWNEAARAHQQAAAELLYP